jgi:hypothetical protein
MSPLAPSSSLSPNLQDETILDAMGQGKVKLAARVEEQRANIQALELAAEERRRAVFFRS